MIQLLYIRNIDPDQRYAGMIALFVFLLCESIALQLLFDRVLGYFAGMCAALVGVWVLRHRSGRSFRLPVMPDAALYLALFAGTVLVGIVETAAPSERGLLLPRVDIELLVAAIVCILAAATVVAINDIWILRQDSQAFRHPDKFSDIPLGLRRYVSMILGVCGIAAVASLVLMATHDALIGSIVIFCFGLLMLWSFEYLYGYRSYIMRIYGASVIAASALALVLHSRYAWIVPPIIVYVGFTLWTASLIPAVTQIWRNSSNRILDEAQNGGHTLYLSVLAGGVLIIFAYWIYPVLPPRPAF